MLKHFLTLAGCKMYCLTITAVGNDVSKKTQLLAKYTGRENHQNINVLEEVIVDHIRYLVNFIDTESSDAYFSLRRDAIEKADCIILCYSVIHKGSFKNLISKWCLEVRECNSNVPIILVGTEIEKRRVNDDENCVSHEEGETLKKLIGAFSFVECSLDSFIGVDDVFIQAIRSVISRYYFSKPLIKMK